MQAMNRARRLGLGRSIAQLEIAVLGYRKLVARQVTDPDTRAWLQQNP